MRAVEMLATLSVMCALAAGTCLILARRSTGGWVRVFNWFAVVLAVAALGPPVFVMWAVER